MAIELKNKNFAYSKLLSGIAHDATTLQVSSGDGDLFPATGPFMAVIWSGSLASPLLDLSREIVKMERVSGDVFTITRAQEGTGASSWLASDNIAHVITAGKLDEIEAEILSNGSDISLLETAVTDLQNTRLKLDGSNSMSVADWGGLKIHGVGTVVNGFWPGGGGGAVLKNYSNTGLYLDGPDVVLYGSLTIPNNKALYLKGNSENAAYLVNSTGNILQIVSGVNGFAIYNNAAEFIIQGYSHKTVEFAGYVVIQNGVQILFRETGGGYGGRIGEDGSNIFVITGGTGGIVFKNQAETAQNISISDAGEVDIKRGDLKVSSGNIHVSPSSTEAPFVIGANGQGELVTGLNADQWEGLHAQDLLDLICPNFIEGFTLSNNSSDPNNDIDFGPGRASVDNSSHRYVAKTTSTMTKQLDASWAAGNNQGGLFSGSKANSTWYHCFVIRKDSDGSIDFGFDTSVTAANIPSGYSAYRRIGSIRTDASGNILGFDQWGDEFWWKDPLYTHDTTNPGTSAVLAVMAVPPGLRVEALFNWMHYTPNVNKMIYFSSVGVNDEAPSSTDAPLATNWSDSSTAQNTMDFMRLPTNTTQQIRYRQDDPNTSTVVRIATLGWIDPRGRT
jgi:hypothetical protein